MNMASSQSQIYKEQLNINFHREMATYACQKRNNK